MRRHDREITDKNEIMSIMKKCDCCRIAFFDKEFPYIIPMNFGTANENNKLVLYFHCASEGKKLDLIKKNPNVSFEMDCSHKLINNDIACRCTMEFESVVGNGIATIVNENKEYALTKIMQGYSDKKEFNFDKNELLSVTVFKVDVVNVTGKRLKK